MTLDITKPVQTRDGRQAVILHHRSPTGSLRADILTNGNWSSCAYYIDGRYSRGDEVGIDLVNVPEIHPKLHGQTTYYLNLGDGYTNAESAQAHSDDYPVIQLDIDDGKVTASVVAL